jgi:hypothetical protein
VYVGISNICPPDHVTFCIASSQPHILIVRHVGESVIITENDIALTNLDFLKVESVGGNFEVTDNRELQSISELRLGEVGGKVEIRDNHALKRISFSNTSLAIRGWLWFEQNHRLT